MKKLSDFVKCYENLIDPKLCDKIVNREDMTFNRASTGSKGLRNPDRNCYVKTLEDEFSDDIFKIVSKALKLYSQEEADFHTGDTTEDTGYQHLLYLGSEKGEYREHTDHADLFQRVLSCSLILNDDYEGGDFSFFRGEYIIPKKAGSVVVFPSNFCFPHAITPVTKGNRHAIITWIH